MSAARETSSFMGYSNDTHPLSRLPETGDDLVDFTQVYATIPAPGIIEHHSSFSDGSRDIWDEVQIEQWKYVRSLGRGGFGHVHLEEKVFERFRPMDTGPKIRAVKIIPDKNGSFKTRKYLPEILGMAKFSKLGASFIQLFAWFQIESNICIAMEWAPFGDLDDAVKDALPESEAIEIARQVAHAVVIMHDKSFLHRDLKPKNVFVFKKRPEHGEWRVKLGDFGVSKRVHAAANTSWHTSIDADCSAPEILGLLPGYFSEETSYANPVDMWSMGYLVHWLLTRQFPVSRFALPRFCNSMNPIPLSKLAERGVSRDALDFVENLLHLEPNNRMVATAAYQHSWLNPRTGNNLPMSGSAAKLSGMLHVDTQTTIKTPELLYRYGTLEPDHRRIVSMYERNLQTASQGNLRKLAIRQVASAYPVIPESEELAGPGSHASASKRNDGILEDDDEEETFSQPEIKSRPEVSEQAKVDLHPATQSEELDGHFNDVSRRKSPVSVRPTYDLLSPEVQNHPSTEKKDEADKVVAEKLETMASRADMEINVLSSFKKFADLERERYAVQVRARENANRADKINDLKRFAKTFQVKTPIPTDLVNILAKDPAKQAAIVEKAKKVFEHASTSQQEVKEDLQQPVENRNSSLSTGYLSPPLISQSIDDGSNDAYNYCHCNGRLGYGEIIACNNTVCSKKWFHLDCLGLTSLPDTRTWFCDECLHGSLPILVENVPDTSLQAPYTAVAWPMMTPLMSANIQEESAPKDKNLTPRQKRRQRAKANRAAQA